MKSVSFVASLSMLLTCGCIGQAQILTPKPPATPRINGARVFGARPIRPFLFTIPATGEEPITFSVSGLPKGLTLDAHQGRITGSVGKEGDYRIKITAANALGKDTRALLLKIGDRISLTPPMGWNSWNCFAGARQNLGKSAVSWRGHVENRRAPRCELTI